MARFRFPLQKVLDYRIQQEEEAKLKFAQAQAELERLKKKQQKVEEEIEEIHSIFKQSKVVNHSWFFAECERSLMKERQELERDISQQFEITEEKKREYLARRLERKKMERLKENQKRAFYYEELKKEQKEADEISTLRFERNFY